MGSISKNYKISVTSKLIQQALTIFFNIDVIVFPFEHQGPVKERLSNPYSSVFSNLMQICHDDLFNIGVDSIKTLCYIT